MFRAPDGIICEILLTGSVQAAPLEAVNPEVLVPGAARRAR